VGGEGILHLLRRFKKSAGDEPKKRCEFVHVVDLYTNAITLMMPCLLVGTCINIETLRAILSNKLSHSSYRQCLVLSPSKRPTLIYMVGNATTADDGCRVVRRNKVYCRHSSTLERATLTSPKSVAKILLPTWTNILVTPSSSLTSYAPTRLWTRA